MQGKPRCVTDRDPRGHHTQSIPDLFTSSLLTTLLDLPKCYLGRRESPDPERLVGGPGGVKTLDEGSPSLKTPYPPRTGPEPTNHGENGKPLLCVRTTLLLLLFPDRLRPGVPTVLLIFVGRDGTTRHLPGSWTPLPLPSNSVVSRVGHRQGSGRHETL